MGAEIAVLFETRQIQVLLLTDESKRVECFGKEFTFQLQQALAIFVLNRFIKFLNKSGCSSVTRPAQFSNFC